MTLSNLFKARYDKYLEYADRLKKVDALKDSRTSEQNLKLLEEEK